ncbi:MULTISPECIES: transferrin-binding protein-like solute binding protein [unclassified Neisseria]|uniref:transferrin-binding protein-like solute binding protein n=1 Tax=unclassified Neisseria TaxID=2623750 RepID=UPI00266697A8|nr:MULTISPECIES: transferrin-binding protein-like solute binding protein [unclassified Neisseria]MDO1508775.1 transferrin-binding protein-like solute binding protein [Neisseria sp. MVDL19-042950]MDO1515034.1 transferrin-binding protein-like solute binding protein [Neisseria sp. MVDL18-041461]MDO1562394.1 transferrin-binding protein-like solute binding protein [Neisseria sp. MVDL20-010259]
MSKKMSAKHIALTVICAAMLAACGGGGGDPLNTQLVENARAARNVMDQIEQLDAPEEITIEDKQAVEAALAGFRKLGPAERSLVSKELLEKLNAVVQALETAGNVGVPPSADGSLGEAITDNKSLEPLNLPTPLHTSFISSAGAQQHNPHMQLRTVNGKPALVDTQIGLIRSLASNKNSAVVIDGVVLNNTTAGDNATEVSFATPHSGIGKAFSSGTSKEDISAQTGDEPNTVFSPVKTSLDKVIEANYVKLKAAKEALEKAEKALAKAEKDKVDAEALADAKKAKDEALKEKVKIENTYNKDRAVREELAKEFTGTVNNLAYIKKDKDNLVFNKAFDGVYIIQFNDGTQVVLHDSAAAGWTYQTFAHYTDTRNGVTHAYQSLGDETPIASIPKAGTATYRGLTTAYLREGNENLRLTADVTAVADFAKKALRFETSNSHFHALANGVRVSSKADEYDMKGSAVWTDNSNSFKGEVNTANKAMTGTLNGKFYGANVAEIGGTYGLSGKDKQLIGGYGAKRP